MSVKLPVLGLVSHQRRVCQLYKSALRNAESFMSNRHLYRYQATLLRARFDANKNEHDMIKARKFLTDGEEELFQRQHGIPRKFPHSPGGVAFEREVIPPDWVLDHWHPLEKAQYPEYFARREQRKKEFVERWEKTYGKPTAEDVHH
ncbi:NADH dehydrogenase (ubiquinone) B22 subunit [Arctopsyche grandis]|uniref:NADH dehydrogenase (ubiquinone) B22 subunit n=1 Tax=Arctopsyche grandis TaxID=121162 RepID=UPI00406D6B1E